MKTKTQTTARHTFKESSIQTMMQANSSSSYALRVLFLLVFRIFNSSSASSVVGQELANILPAGRNHAQRTLQEVLDRFEIGESIITFAGTVIQLIFPLNDEVSDGSVSTTIFSDNDCSVDITENEYIVPTIIYDDNPNPDGTKNRRVTVRYDVDPTLIQSTDVWVQNENSQFFMNFCMSLSLHQGDAETSDPISTLETTVRLQVDLVGDFGNEFEVLPTDPGSESVLQKYFVEGYLCDDQLQEIEYLLPLVQGSKVKVCVKPTDDALQDGFYMRRVDSFTYSRDNPTTGNQISQTALVGGESANPALTELFCERGWELCHFDTLLRSDFYFGPGRVFGYGEAWLQFGTGSARKLTFAIARHNNVRSLQEVDGGFAGSVQFNINFDVTPGEEFTFGAVAYECDRQNKKIKDPSPKKLGSAVKVCVTPDEESLQYGMTINRIDSWNWTRSDGISQVSAEVGGEQAEDGLTILMCVPGATMCIFRTQCTEDFYLSDGSAVGVGNVVLQFAPLIRDDQITFSRRRSLESSHPTPRQLQLGDLLSGIAGMATVGVNVPVAKKTNKELPEHCRYEHKITDWWVEEPMNDRYMYIGVAVGILAAIGCSLLFCWFCPCLARRDEEEEIIEEDIEGGMKVNVNLNSSKDENVISNTTNKRASSSKSLLAGDATDSTGGSDQQKRNSSKRSGLSVSDGSDHEPEKYDVIFGDESHPGTKRLLKSIRRYQKDSPDEQYGPHAYRLIKKELGDTRYFRLNKKGRPVEASKKKAVELMWDMFDDAAPKKLKRSSSSRGLDDLEKSNRRSKFDDAAPKKMKRSSSSRGLDDLDSNRRRSRNVEETTTIRKSSSTKSLGNTRKSSSNKSLKSLR